jgi:hypothetical protein
MFLFKELTRALTKIAFLHMVDKLALIEHVLTAVVQRLLADNIVVPLGV